MGIISSIINDSFSKKEIESVKLMGVTSQCVDFKLHAILDYQEDIYANVYSFFVTYVDGTTQVIQTHKDKEVSYYMSFVDQLESNENNIETKTNNESTINALDELEKLKRLLDSGVIPEEIYEKKRLEYIDILNGVQQKVHVPNGSLMLKRSAQLAGSAAGMNVYIDDKLVGKQAVGDEDEYELPFGKHTIRIEATSLINTTTIGKYTFTIGEKNPNVSISYKMNLSGQAAFNETK